MKPQRIILTGFMGTGKSTVGLLLAEELGWPFLDTDHLVEARAGRTIPEIFATDGEPAFRDLESAVLKESLDKSPAVVATGGGAVIKPENLLLMKKAGRLVALTARPDVILERVAAEQDPGERPLLQGPDPKAEILRLIKSRQEAYDKADYVVDTSEQEPEEIAALILEWVANDSAG